jgi:predicted dehydrogenase/threonine dehydrogenase-like Zn-dependent dehydrogenase
MKQVLQDIRSGNTEVADVPVPYAASGQALIRTRVSLISAGTERMLVEFGNANWLQKARQQPDKVRMVLEKARTDGVAATMEAVLRKLDQPLPMGYCNVGEVVEGGKSAGGFSPGDRVVSNGKHAEFVAVPANLCARVPDNVSDESAAFTVLGAIALQGIRLAQPTLGECFVVTGLGLIGLLAVQLLRAHGCRVLGTDFDSERVALARSFGAEAIDLSAGADPVKEAERFSQGRGVDGVLITASTRSSEPIHQAALMCRKRGRIVLVGVTGLELSRADFYEKELTFQVSCSYGPGRYDAEYEEKGRDYPIGYVRWTEQRNFEAVLAMMADNRLDVSSLLSHRFAIQEAPKAYELIGSSTPSLGVLLEYRQAQGSRHADARTVQVSPASESAKATLGFIGAGNYATGVLIPAFKSTHARLKAVSSANGVSGTYAARKFGIELSTTDTATILEDAEVTGVVISTRHASHAEWVTKVIAAGKHVFVEKPLAMTIAELGAVERAYLERTREAGAVTVTVGFNRRFAPHVLKISQWLGAVPGPKSFVMTVNAGTIPRSHWTQDPEVGGGRLLGEACHFVDLLRFLADSPIVSVSAIPLRDPSGPAISDTCTISLSFADGSIGTIHYFANGHKSLPKERLEVFAQGRVIRLDNFRRLDAHGWPGANSMRLWRQDKGQKACAAAFVRAIETGIAPIPFDQLIEVARVTIEASEAVRDT